MKPLLPGSTIGILGSGQLGRMLALAAQRMGYRTHVYSPEKNSPAEHVCDACTVASYTDAKALAAFAASVDVVTFEFENVPFESAAQLAQETLVRPRPEILHTAQHRGREKTFLQQAGIPVVPFAWIRKASEVEAAVKAVGLPGVLKTAGFGYDGKGQHKVATLEDVARVVSASNQEWVLERWQDFEKEASVLVARGTEGNMVDWGAIENAHANHILDVSHAPADVSARTAQELVATARTVAEKLDLVGLLCVEFFVAKDGSVCVNELAPRPHNSGHWTIEGSITSQFEQQVRAVCGLSLGSTEILAPSAMANVLGDVWANGEPDWQSALNAGPAKWHSYGKAEPRPGRKMGHFTAVAKTTAAAREAVIRARSLLTN